MKQGDSKRLLALEGLRGVAAIIVVVYHILLMFWCAMIFGFDGNGGVQNMRFEDNLFASPLFALYSGTFAVAIFFVLSGFVLSIGYFTTGKIEIIQKLAAKRYLRLMIPALASVMIAWLLITLGLSYSSEAFAFTRSIWLEDKWNFNPDFFAALWQGTWGIFTVGEVYYNSVLWTMLFEFIGSFVVFLVLILFGKLEKRWIVYVFLIIFTYQTWYMAFIIGMILADLYVKNKFPFNDASPKLMSFFLVLGLFFGGYPLFAPTQFSIYNTLKVTGLSDVQNLSLYTTLGATLVIIGVLAVPKVRKLFASKLISSLGKYTFSLYLVHKLVLFSFTAGVFVWFMTFMQFNQAALFAILLSIPVIVVSTYLFERYVDAPSIRVSGVFANYMLGLPQRVGTGAYIQEDKKSVARKMYESSVHFIKKSIKKK